MNTLSHTLTEHTIKFYLCANCWGPLKKLPAGGTDWLVGCAKDDSHTGFVTKHYVEKRRQADGYNRMDATRLLRQIGVVPNPHKGKTEADLLKEMGF